MAEITSGYPRVIYDAQTRGTTLPKHLAVEMWSTFGANDGSDLGLATKFPLQEGDNSVTNARECHTGENNGSAQRRLAPRRGKYSDLPGLQWMKDISMNISSWSGNTGDENCANGSTRDHVAGGPYTQMFHWHVLECAGYDYLTLYWQAHCLSYEGLTMEGVGSLADATAASFSDYTRLVATGMPSIDSRESIFSIPKIVRMNSYDKLAYENQSLYNADPRTLSGTGVASTNVITFPRAHGALAGDAITFTAAPTGITANSVYYVIASGLTTVAMKVSTTVGGAEVDITADGTATIGNLARTFTASAATDVLTFTNNHGKADGEPVQLWNTGGALPATASTPHLTVGKTYYARDVTPTTMKLALLPGGAALDLTGTGTGTHGILLNQHDPGTGVRASAFLASENTGSLNLTPQQWIQGGQPLWAKWRMTTYPGTDVWYHYDEIHPKIGFETLGTELAIGGLQGQNGPMFSQYGRIWKTGATRQAKFVGPGDYFEATIQVGYPNTRTVATNAGAVGGTPTNAYLTYQPDLFITGLARIAFCIGGISMSWDGSGSGNCLVSNPVSPATAPRQHIRGRLVAVLSRR